MKSKLTPKEFQSLLTKRVRLYFKESKLRKTEPNLALYGASVFVLVLWILPSIFPYFYQINLLEGIIYGLLTGMGTAGVGMVVMHSAAHGSFYDSTSKNKRLAKIINWLMGYVYNWWYQHNVKHHTHTNVDGYDDDINPSGTMVFAKEQKRYFIHKFQAFYAPFFYGIMTIYWYFFKDWVQIRHYFKEDKSTSDEEKKKHMKSLIYAKIRYAIQWIVLPLLLWNCSWEVVLAFFLAKHFAAGLTLSLVFQPAHVVPKARTYASEDCPKGLDFSHQMKTTCNFSVNNKVLTYLVGGLNYQIEHHLFPSVLFIHYPAIRGIVLETLEEYDCGDIQYNEYNSFPVATVQHFIHLHRLGNGKVK
jgi:linoleoyl-CoA desaturase